MRILSSYWTLPLYLLLFGLSIGIPPFIFDFMYRSFSPTAENIFFMLLFVVAIVFVTAWPVLAARFLVWSLQRLIVATAPRVALACLLAWYFEEIISYPVFRFISNIGRYGFPLEYLYGFHVAFSLFLYACKSLRGYSASKIRKSFSSIFVGSLSEDLQPTNTLADAALLETDKISGQLPADDKESISRISQIREFHNRADDLIGRSNSVLIIIVFVLIFSGIFVVFANAISQFGVARPDVVFAMT